jgi:hypothetical protein
VKELDLTHNLIGSSESLNVVQPDIVTGGEAIAECLTVNMTLKILRLGWNHIAKQSAITLAKSMRMNSHLTHLDLSYNAFTDEGSQALGLSLRSSKNLRFLDLSYNGVSSRAAIVIASAVRQRRGRQLLLKLHGTMFSVEALTAFVRVFSSDGCSCCRLELRDCDFTQSGHNSTSIQNSFDWEEPSGPYLLDCSSPYERTVAMELLVLAEEKRSCR